MVQAMLNSEFVIITPNERSSPAKFNKAEDYFYAARFNMV